MFIYKLVCLLMMTTASAAIDCPDGYRGFPTAPLCYKKSPNQMNYDEAYRYCQAQGGEMADKKLQYYRHLEGKNHTARL